MRGIRQRRKESSLVLPATSLHLMQVGKFIEEYLHCQQKYLVNLSAAAVHTHLPLRHQHHHPDNSFDIDLDVPYIESQHYDSHTTFTDDHKDIDLIIKNTLPRADPDDENFTDREGDSVFSESEEVSCRQRKTVQDQEEEEEVFAEDDFKFVKHVRASTEVDHNNNSTKESKELAERSYCLPVVEDADLQHLQETAYFLQERERVERRLAGSQQQENVSSLNQAHCPPSKKAIFLSKIEKEKTRKEIAEAINRERHHIKRFLK